MPTTVTPLANVTVGVLTTIVPSAPAEGRGHGLRALPLLHNATHQFGSATRRQAGILMDVHSVLQGI